MNVNFVGIKAPEIIRKFLSRYMLHVFTLRCRHQALKFRGIIPIAQVPVHGEFEYPAKSLLNSMSRVGFPLRMNTKKKATDCFFADLGYRLFSKHRVRIDSQRAFDIHYVFDGPGLLRDPVFSDLTERVFPDPLFFSDPGLDLCPLLPVVLDRIVTLLEQLLSDQTFLPGCRK